MGSSVKLDVVVTVLFVSFAAMIVTATWTVSSLRGQLGEAKAAFAACQEELSVSQEEVKRCEAEEERRRKVEEQVRRDRETRSGEAVKKANQFVEELPCRLDIINWQGRVEGDANLPPGSVKAAVEAMKAGRDFGYTAAQKRRLARALRENPVPECAGEEDSP